MTALLLCCTGLSITAPPARPWRGLHISVGSPEAADDLKRLVVDVLAPMGINTVIAEVNYSFQFQSHPELSNGTLTAEAAADLAATCEGEGVRLIPLFNCLGHQSWADVTFPLLAKHPEFDETPQIPLDNPGIYCRSWCPQHPQVNTVVFELIDEILSAFHADAFHVGMDEVFLIASDQCPRCRGGDPAALFAQTTNDLHEFLVKRRGVEMLMWGDRLLDAATTGYGQWEASANGTAAAIDRIPKDIIICDWHYEPMADYPSVRYFQEQGFRVWPATWNKVEAAEALLECALRDPTDRMMGYLFTGWGVNSPDLRDRLQGRTTGKDCPVADVILACLPRLNANAL
ncbi:MAG TPA: family 20 glycosylhydrolase [Armatimonadota bacterium]|nr:family 20 glycosylhydrolase [Armatimonadota bacterium]HQK92612.1 family 20 glycosylhydrolase [Armatimonadota bacterium]